MFEQWLLENQLSSPFRLSELFRKFGINHKYVGVHGDLKIVKLIKTLENDLANEVDGKYFILPNFVQTEFVEKVEDVTGTKTSKVKKPQSGDESSSTGV